MQTSSKLYIKFMQEIKRKKILNKIIINESLNMKLFKARNMEI